MKNGFLIPLHDKKLFQEKLQYLVDNSNELEEIMRSSFAEAKNWKKEKGIRQWETIL